MGGDIPKGGEAGGASTNNNSSVDAYKKDMAAKQKEKVEARIR